MARNTPKWTVSRHWKDEKASEARYSEMAPLTIGNIDVQEAILLTVFADIPKYSHSIFYYISTQQTSIMVFGFSSQPPWEKADTSIEDLLAASR